MSLFHHDHHEDSTDEWATPRQFVQPLAEAVGGFDLDPASGAEDSPHADEQYTEEDDGLAQEWSGNVWLNPPFSQKADWLAKVRDEYENGDVDLAVVLLPVDTSTQWFHEHVVEADVLWFKEGRLNFRGGGGSNRNPNFGVMLAVYGDAPRELLEVLESRGVVFEQSGRFASTRQETLVTDGGEPEYTPRRHLEGTLTQLENREKAVRTILGANQKADRNTIHYLQGYYDALQLVTDEVRQAKDAEIMGITPGDSDE